MVLGVMLRSWRQVCQNSNYSRLRLFREKVVVRDFIAAYGSLSTSNVSKRNVKIYSETFGDPNTNLAPVFVSHGMMGSSTNWLSLAKQLNKKTGRQIVTYDARNHGQSGHADSMSYEEMSADLLSLINAHFHGERGEKKVVLMGHSMGGRTAMYTALTRPELVDRLVVVDVSPVNIDFSTMDATEWNMAHFFHTMNAVKFLQPEDDEKWSISKTRKDADSQMSLRIKDQGLRSWLLMNMAQDEVTKRVGWRHNLKAIQKAFETHVRHFPNEDLPEDVKYEGPTTFVGGADSQYIPVADHPEILEKFPKAEFYYVEGAGHWVHSQKPEEFLNIVIKKLL